MALTAQKYHNCQRTKPPGTAQAKIEEISIFQAAQLGFSHLWPTAITCEASKGGCPRAERAIHSRCPKMSRDQAAASQLAPTQLPLCAVSRRDAGIKLSVNLKSGCLRIANLLAADII